MKIDPNKCLSCQKEKDDLKEAKVNLNLVRDGKTLSLKFTAMVCDDCADEVSEGLHELTAEAEADGVSMTLGVTVEA